MLILEWKRPFMLEKCCTYRHPTSNYPIIKVRNVSDTVSESSDNATLMSLSLTDLTALGAGQIREDIRVNRKKLESLIIRERDMNTLAFCSTCLCNLCKKFHEKPLKITK